MNIVLTGSLGNIGRPLTGALVAKGHQVTVISSNPGRQAAIEALGAKAAIGTMEDPDFLAQTFQGADIVYLMETLGNGTAAFFDHSLDATAAITQIGHNYKQAIGQAGVKRVVHLSSIGADKGPGLLRFHYNVEQLLNELPGDVSIKFMRAVGFYYTLFAFLPTIKSQGLMMANYSGDTREPWVAPEDIAAVIAEEMELPFSGRQVRYIASDEVSPNELAALLGEAVGKPDVQWQEVSDEQFLNGLLAAGMNPQTAKGYMEMNAARRGGVLYEDYYRHQPTLGPTKLKDFARTFAAVYNQ